MPALFYEGTAMDLPLEGSELSGGVAPYTNVGIPGFSGGEAHADVGHDSPVLSLAWVLREPLGSIDGGLPDCCRIVA